MQWDFAERLSHITRGTTEAYYNYDGGGIRTRKVVEKNGVTEIRLYLGGFEIWRKTVNGVLNTERETLHVMDDSTRVAVVETLTVDNSSAVANLVPVLRYQLDNHLGSASLELDDLANVISYEEYYPYGDTSYQAGRSASEVSQKRYRYTGKEKDEESGLYYHGARYYACWLGRWTASDPAGMVDGVNLYMYVRGNPVSGVDPSGNVTENPANIIDDLPGVKVTAPGEVTLPGVDINVGEASLGDQSGSASGNFSSSSSSNGNLSSNSSVTSKGVKSSSTTPEPKNAELTSTARTTIAGTEAIKSYSGEFPSPFKAMWYVPESNEFFKVRYRAQEIRSWVRDASKYHDVPYEMLAVILQQENGPNATSFQKFGQFAERTLTTVAAIMDKNLWDIIPDKIAGGSSGFANMSRKTLNDAASYTEQVYGKNPLPDDVRFRAFGWDQDTRISGDDWKADLYYAAAHLRQLIDRVKGQEQFHGSLSLDEAELVFAAYNGSGH
jgi:RHS repeat-associated protein